MRSVGMTMPLQERLARLGRSEEDDQPSPDVEDEEMCSENVSDGMSHSQGHLVMASALGSERAGGVTPGRISTQSNPPIHTPQALLSRDPSHLASCLGTSTVAVLNLRALVADSMALGKSSHGLEASEIVASVSVTIRNFLNEADQRKTLRRPCVTEDTSSMNQMAMQPLFHRNRPPAIIAGAASCLDLCINALLSKDSESSSKPLSTGSLRLDELLGAPSDVMCGGQSCWVHQSSTLPPNMRKRRRIGDKPRSIFGLGQASEHSGVLPGLVTEIFGPSSTGKTQVALTVAADAALRGWTVHYLAGGGGSATVLPLARRLRQLLSEKSRPEITAKHGSSCGDESPMERVLFTTVPDGNHALAALANVESTMHSLAYRESKTRHEKPINKDILVILDSASGCLSPNLFSEGDGGAGAAMVNEIGLVLSRLSRTAGRSCRCSVLITNGTVSSVSNNDSISPSSFKPAMGKLWRASDIRIKVVTSSTDNSSEGLIKQSCSSNGMVISPVKNIRATLVKHFAKSLNASKSSSITATYGISASGVVDV